ncbi:uncharacterized protein ACO6RY_15580 [Pungitius sinensis]
MDLVFVSIMSIVLNVMRVSRHLPINPTILRVFRVLRLAQILKAKRIRALPKTIIKTLSQVGNISLLFLFFFSIYAALGVEFFGHLGQSHCQQNKRMHRGSQRRLTVPELTPKAYCCQGNQESS